MSCRFCVVKLRAENWRRRFHETVSEFRARHCYFCQHDTCRETTWTSLFFILLAIPQYMLAQLDRWTELLYVSISENQISHVNLAHVLRLGGREYKNKKGWDVLIQYLKLKAKFSLSTPCRHMWEWRYRSIH